MDIFKDFICHTINHNDFYITPERAIWWPEQESLLISDLHLGKATHFNINGFALPNTHAKRDINRLTLLCELLRPKRFLILGDVFHSILNTEINLLLDFRNTFKNCEMHIVIGNHDIIAKNIYIDADFIIHNENFEIENFIMVHDFNHINFEQIPLNKFVFSGHIHPGFRLVGKANQSAYLPCYYFNERLCVLPAFGSLTGLYSMQFKSIHDHVYVIVNDQLVDVPNLLKINC